MIFDSYKINQTASFKVLFSKMELHAEDSVYSGGTLVLGARTAEDMYHYIVNQRTREYFKWKTQVDTLVIRCTDGA